MDQNKKNLSNLPVLFCHQTKYIKGISGKITRMVSNAKIKLKLLKLVPKFKINKSLKLLLTNMKPNSSIFMRLEWQRGHKRSRNP